MNKIKTTGQKCVKPRKPQQDLTKRKNNHKTIVSATLKFLPNLHQNWELRVLIPVQDHNLPRTQIWYEMEERYKDKIENQRSNIIGYLNTSTSTREP